MMMGFIDTMRSEGHTVLSICRVLREQGCQIAARTNRAWRGRHVAAGTITDAHVLDVVRDTAWVDVIDATCHAERDPVLATATRRTIAAPTRAIQKQFPSRR
jgi:hypothetical protein